MLKKLLIALVFSLLIVPLIIQAQDDEAARPILLIGTVVDTPDEFVGLVIDGDQITVYICDGQTETNTVSVAEWFTGTFSEDETEIEITAASGHRVEVTLDEEKATGQITLKDGTIKPFSLKLASGDAALYRSEFAFGEDEFVGGWLVLEDGSIRGAVRKKESGVIVPALINANIAARMGGTQGIKDGSSNTAQ